jgi:oligopeptidase B
VLIFERTDGLEKLSIWNARTGESHYIEMPEALYQIGGLDDPELFKDLNREFNTSTVRFRYDSFKTPPTIFDYDMNTRQLKKVEEIVVPGFDASQYHVERVEATADDGTPLQVLLAWKGELIKDGQRRLHLYGYGAYGMCALWAGHFRMSRLCLLDRGVVFACAYIRGGGEQGQVGHDQGKMLNKRNTFTDFIACGDYLVREGYTQHDRMSIEGRSAGGLLIGAVLNMRSGFCKAAVAGVPFVDVINTMLDDSIPLTVGEFLEWGNPKIREFFELMLSYSPYDNIGPKNYPSIFVHSALRDSAVPYWEPAKYVAKLRATKTDNNPLLFRILLDGGGHAGLSGRSETLREDAFRLAFILDQLGIEK